MKRIITLSTLTLFSIQMSAQMSDISVTLQPTASYNWFDKNTHIDQGIMYGARVGFGFGESIELRGIYEKSVDIRNTISNLNFANEDFLQNFTTRDVEIQRFGGEFKANIPTRATIVPYLTLGAGVQKLKVNIAEEGFPEVVRKSEQIYGNVGLGTQIRLADRVFLTLEGRNTIFNMNPADVLYREGANSGVGGWLNDRTERMYNWSALAGLQFYLGGQKPGTMTDLDKAYYDKFSGGMKGFKLIVEPSVAYIDFHKKANLNNTYLLGGKIGFDFNEFVGIRGYYFQASTNEELSTNWDDLAMYGADITAQLNVARGIVPYIELGGGYLNVYEGNKGKNALLPVQESGYFAKGGLGLSVPIFTNFEIFGSASIMYTSARAENDIQNIVKPSELTKHNMYNAGIKFKIGQKSENTSAIIDRRIDARVKARTDVYEDRIKQLERELQKAYDENDTKKAVEIIEEKKAIEDRKKEIVEEEQAIAKPMEVKVKKPEESRVKMTPAELEALIEKVIQGVDEESNKPATTEDRIDRLERLLLEINTGGSQAGVVTPVQQDFASERIINKLEQLNTKIDNNSAEINRLASTPQPQAQEKTIVVTQEGTSQQPQIIQQPQVIGQPLVAPGVSGTNVATTAAIPTALLLNEGVSIFAGVGFGEGAGAALGVRGHYAFSNSPIKFMPDLYISPSKNTGFGINANALLAFDKLSGNVIVEPYIGLGLGYNKIGDFNRFGTNVIVGTSFNVLGGSLYADYTIRGLFKMNQIAVGYKFGF